MSCQAGGWVPAGGEQGRLLQWRPWMLLFQNTKISSRKLCPCMMSLGGGRDSICPSLIRAALCQRDVRDSDPSPQESRWVLCRSSRAQRSFANVDIRAHSGSNSINYMGMSSVSLACCFPCQWLWTSSKASHLEHSVLAPRRVTRRGNPNGSFSVGTNQGLLTCALVYCSYVPPHTTDEPQELPRHRGWMSLFFRDVGEGSSGVRSESGWLSCGFALWVYPNPCFMGRTVLQFIRID